jgi:hypothetical protein
MTEMVEILLQPVEILPPLQTKYLHQKRQEMTLILRKVEVVEVMEIFSILDEWMVTTSSSFNQLAIILQF